MLFIGKFWEVFEHIFYAHHEYFHRNGNICLKVLLVEYKIWVLRCKVTDSFTVFIKKNICAIWLFQYMQECSEFAF
jgi:hypothetical protein